MCFKDKPIASIQRCLQQLLDHASAGTTEMDTGAGDNGKSMIRDDDAAHIVRVRGAKLQNHYLTTCISTYAAFSCYILPYHLQTRPCRAILSISTTSSHHNTSSRQSPHPQYGMLKMTQNAAANEHPTWHVRQLTWFFHRLIHLLKNKSLSSRRHFPSSYVPKVDALRVLVLILSCVG